MQGREHGWVVPKAFNCAVAGADCVVDAPPATLSLCRYVCLQRLQQRGPREPLNGSASSLAPAHHTHIAQGTPSQAVTGTDAPGQTTGVATDSIADASSSRGGSGADAGSSGEGHQLQLPPGSVPWLRPLPTPLALMPGELRWLYPDLHTDLIWDSTLGERGAEASEVSCGVVYSSGVWYHSYLVTDIISEI